MLAGKLYDPSDPELASLRRRAHELCLEFNGLKEGDETRREEVLRELLPDLGEGSFFQGPVQFDYGCFTHIGKNSFANFNFTCLDVCPVTIGSNVFFGPNVSLYTPLHPLRWQERNIFVKPDGTGTDREYGKPIVIGDNCWIGGSVTICAGVHIGEGCVIGAGSVVTRDIPAHSLAVGNPCRPIRQITDKDRMEDDVVVEGWRMDDQMADDQMPEGQRENHKKRDEGTEEDRHEM